MNYLILAMALAGGTLSGCTTSKTALEQRRAEASWNAFCDANGYNRDDNTCEIGLTTNGGIPYKSIAYLVYEASEPQK